MEARWRSGEPLEERWAKCPTNLPGSYPTFLRRVSMIKVSVTDLKNTALGL